MSNLSNKFISMKKIFALLLCALFVLPLIGCKNTPTEFVDSPITMQVVAGRTSVSQKFAFPAFSKQANEQDKEAYLQDLQETLRVKVWNRMFLNYFAVYSARPYEKYVIGGDLVKFENVYYNNRTDAMEFSFNFLSYGAWKYYHSSDKEEDSDTPSDIFIDVNASSATFPFAQKSGDVMLGQTYADILNDVWTKHNILKQPLRFRYDYTTIHKRLHSNGQRDNIDGYYHHSWTCALDELSSAPQIEIWTVSAVRAYWYLVVLAVGVGGTLIALFIAFIIKKNKKQKNEG